MRAEGGLALVGSRVCAPAVLGAHTDHVYSRCAFLRRLLCTRHLVLSPRTCFVTTTLRATIAMENVTVRESARLRARRAAESDSTRPQASTQPGPDPAATATATQSTV